MTTSDSEPARQLPGLVWVIVAFAVLFWCLVLLRSHLSPWMTFGCLAVATAIADALALVMVARRSTRRHALLCGGFGLASLTIQAGGLYVSVLLVLNRFTFHGSGWLFWTLPAAAVATSALLLSRRPSRGYGWAVLIGSAEGFAGFIAFVAAVVAACDCMD